MCAQKRKRRDGVVLLCFEWIRWQPLECGRERVSERKRREKKIGYERPKDILKNTQNNTQHGEKSITTSKVIYKKNEIPTKG